MHLSSNCLKLAIERKAFSRTLRVTGELRVDALKEFVEQAEMMLAK